MILVSCFGVRLFRFRADVGVYVSRVQDSRVHVFWCFKSIRFYLCRFEVCEFGFELVFRVLGQKIR
jgi:hypothetical protein